MMISVIVLFLKNNYRSFSYRSSNNLFSFYLQLMDVTVLLSFSYR